MKTIPDKVFDEVKKIYLKQIDIPEIKPEVQYILATIGLIGAGKTTVVKPLAEKLGLVRISNDEIRKIFKEEGFGYDRVKKLEFKLVADFLKQEFSVAIDSDCISEESQERIKETKEEFGVKVLWVHINPPEEFILQKLKNLKSNWLGTAEKMIENYYQRKLLHKNLDFSFVYTFDTSKNNLDEQIEEASKKISSNTDPA